MAVAAAMPRRAGAASGSVETLDGLSYAYEIVWVGYDGDDIPVGLRGSMEGSLR